MLNKEHSLCWNSYLGMNLFPEAVIFEHRKKNNTPKYKIL